MLDDRAIAAALHRPDLASLLDEIASEIRHYVVVTTTQADALSLWICHTWAAQAAETTPYLNVSGPTKRVGKTRLLEVLALFCREPIEAANITPAALFRVIEEKVPSVLFDEIDAIFGPAASGNHDDLRGLLNAGHRRGAKAYRCVGEGTRQRVEAFPVFCPKVLCGIGRLPDTLADRSIPIRLARRRRGEEIARLRAKEAGERAAPIREKLARFGEDALDVLSSSSPELPAELDDRAQDGWEPLLAIAELAGEAWPTRARDAALKLSGPRGAEEDEQERGVRLLADIRGIFTELDDTRITTADLIEKLAEDDEAPWGTWHSGSRISPRSLAKILRPFGPRSGQLWVNGANVKGFEKSAFEDAWNRYLPPDSDFYPLEPLEAASAKGLRAFSYPLDEGILADRKTGSNPHGKPGLAGLADRNPKQGEKRERATFAKRRLEAWKRAAVAGQVDPDECHLWSAAVGVAM